MSGFLTRLAARSVAATAAVSISEPGSRLTGSPDVTTSPVDGPQLVMPRHLSLFEPVAPAWGFQPAAVVLEAWQGGLDESVEPLPLTRRGPMASRAVPELARASPGGPLVASAPPPPVYEGIDGRRTGVEDTSRSAPSPEAVAVASVTSTVSRGLETGELNARSADAAAPMFDKREPSRSRKPPPRRAAAAVTDETLVVPRLPRAQQPLRVAAARVTAADGDADPAIEHEVRAGAVVPGAVPMLPALERAPVLRARASPAHALVTTSSGAGSGEPVVHVSIGRVEIRATTEVPTSRHSSPPHAVTSPMSLGEYLRRRHSEGRR